MNALGRFNIFKSCCSNAAFEEEYSVEMNSPNEVSPRPRAGFSIHFSRESIYQRNFDPFMLSQDNTEALKEIS